MEIPESSTETTRHYHGPEKRGARRIPADYSICVRCPSRSGEELERYAQTRNISPGGVLFLCPDMLEPGTEVSVSIGIPSAYAASLPAAQLDSAAVVVRSEAISPDKDVDGFHPLNLGRLVIGMPSFRPCTPAGVQELLLRSGVELSGKRVVIVGRSNIVGKPLANILMQKADGANATVTVAHSRTENLPEVVGSADVLVAAIGSAEIIPGDWIKPGAVVIDVGVNRVEDSTAKRGYRLVGDVHFESASKVASWITPVPGGVGPMTRVMLMKNTVASAEMALAGRGG